MASASDYLEEAVLKHVLGIAGMSSPAKVYLALGTAAPAESDTSWSAELSGNGYERAPIAFDAPAYNPSGPKYVLGSAVPVYFPKATAAWNNITNFVIFDAKTGGNLLITGLSVASSSVPQDKCLSTSVTVELPTNPFLSAYAVQKLLDHVFRHKSFATPDIHLGLHGMSGEISGGGYARKAWSTWNTISQQAGKAQTSNNGQIRFNTATGNWGVVIKVVVYDQSSGGNELAHNSAAANVNSGDTAFMADTAFTASFG